MSAPAESHSEGHGGHSINLLACFVALLALTAGEFILFEVWHATKFVPKFVMVLMLLVLTLPKAIIVMYYFMHLKFEKHFLVLIAIIPLMMVFLAILPTLTDIMTLKGHDQTDNKVKGLAEYRLNHGGGHDAGHEEGTKEHSSDDGHDHSEAATEH